MTEMVIPSKRSRAPSFADRHCDYPEESHAATIGSDWFQEKETKDETKLKTFLELCGFCKTKLRHDEDVFMYGYFGAFCSNACRAKQMAYDASLIVRSRVIAKAKKGRTCAGIKPKEDEPFVNEESISSPPRFYI